MYQARLIKNRDIKMSKVRESQLCAGGVLLILIILSFSLACLLTTDTSFTAHTASSLLSRLLGESRQSLGDYLDLQADRYFHRGVPHIEKKEARPGFIQSLAEEVQPRAHEHLESAEINEIMPWLRFATRMNPHDMNAYRSAAFWVSQQQHGEPHALAILDEARKDNPSDYRVPMERGMVLLNYGELDKASDAFDAALRLWSKTEGVPAEQKRIDHAALYNYRGFLYELSGRTADAISSYHQDLLIRPEAAGLREVISAIEQGRRTRADAEKTLHVLMSERITPEEYAHRVEGHEDIHD